MDATLNGPHDDDPPDTHSPRQPTDLDRAIGARIREIRRFFKVTQADAADSIGVSYPQMQKYETGANRLSVSALIRLSRVLGISPAELAASVCADLEKDKPRSAGH